jgi:hypothetical protein
MSTRKEGAERTCEPCTSHPASSIGVVLHAKVWTWCADESGGGDSEAWEDTGPWAELPNEVATGAEPKGAALDPFGDLAAAEGSARLAATAAPLSAAYAQRLFFWVDALDPARANLDPSDLDGVAFVLGKVSGGILRRDVETLGSVYRGVLSLVGKQGSAL